MKWMSVIAKPQLLENFRSTQVSNVGLQVWRGALFLSDFILSFPQHFKDKSVLEVASGTGVTSLVAASMAKSVVITGEHMMI